MIAMGAVAIVMLLRSRASISTRKAGVGRPVSSVGQPPKRRQPALRRALFAGAFESPPVRQPHPAVGIDDVAASAS